MFFSRKTYYKLVGLHLALGVGIYVFQPLSRLFLLAAIAYFFYLVVFRGNRREEVLLGAAYVTGFEVLSRMTGGIGFSYEFAKYMVILFLLVGMFFRGFTRASLPYIIYLFLLLPGILFSAINLNYETNIANAIGFNLSGPFCLGIAALYCYKRKLSVKRYNQVLFTLLLPIISTTIYLYLYTPNIRDALSGTGSNFALSGGFGPNQVATVLGLGIFILFSRLFLVKDRLINLLDLALLGLISYRAIITFSRGGVYTALACGALFLFFYLVRSPLKERAILLPKLGVIAGVVVITWIVSSVATMGLIDKRYSNQDAAGRVKQDVTTGRAELLSNELQAFKENPITGIGVGKVKEYRQVKTGKVAASHNEVSRIVSEHGLFGILALMILLITPLFYGLTDKSNLYLFPFIAFWFLTINHSSMRIAAPAFVYGLALISLYREKKATLHRKPTGRKG